jgi:hypothetical protein
MSFCPSAVLLRDRLFPPHDFAGVFSMSPPSTQIPPFTASETSQLPNMNVAPEDSCEQMIATSRVESIQQPLSSSMFNFNQGGQAMDSSAWASPSHLPDQSEEGASFDIGHMSMFQHQPDLTLPPASLGSPNPFTYFPPPQIPTAFEYPAVSPIMSDSARLEMDNEREFSPAIHALPGIHPWLNRSSPYPELPSRGTHSHHPISSSNSPYDEEQVQESLVDGGSPLGRGSSDHDAPYAQWLYECLRDAPGHQMVLRDIYSWGIKNIPKVREAIESDSNAKGWQNSIRHNLSMNQVQ